MKKLANWTAVWGMAVMMAGIAPTMANVDVAQAPLYMGGQVPPNIMLMIDNSGSMSNISIDEPYDPDTTYACNGTTYEDPSVRIDIYITSGGAPYFRQGATTTYRDWSSVVTASGLTGRAGRCFTPGTSYLARLLADTGALGALKSPGNYLPAEYDGNYLNWYFGYNTATNAYGTQAYNFGTDARRKPNVATRMEVTRLAGNSLVDIMDANLRVGLSTYNGQHGGRLLSAVNGMTDAYRTTLKTQLNALEATGMTPLAETLADIGFYFSRGATNLTLHPDSDSPTSETRTNIFSTASALTDHDYTRHESWELGSTPITHSCQKNFAVLMTDGRPQHDRTISAHLRDYAGDCAAGLCDATPNTANTAGSPPGPLPDNTYGNGTHQGRSYESLGSDYLDDVAMALYDMDLRPDLVDPHGVISNLSTYVVGFAEEALQNDPLLQQTVDRAGGEYFVAGNESELVSAFDKVLADIMSKGISSAASIAVNSTRLDSESFIFQARFDSDDWSGQLLAYKINMDGSIGDAEWEASEHFPLRRSIFTYDGTQGRPFTAENITNLTVEQQGHLDDPQGAKTREDVLNYLRGDGEQRNEDHFRTRNTLLGDIVNSDPWFVGQENYGYVTLPGQEGIDYLEFINKPEIKNRTPMIYVGANDGMLHAFNAGKSVDGGGVEMFAYVPKAVYPNLNKLTDPDYTHQYYVDGAPRSGDVYIDVGAGKEWRTILVGSVGAGGRGVYALDVTDPDNFGPSNVLWEFGHSNDACEEGTSRSCREVGELIGQPSIVRLNNGRWGVVFGNGYNSASRSASLFIVDAETGVLIRHFRTVSPSEENDLVEGTTPISITSRYGADYSNGMSTPVVVDYDGDRIADRIYAGDLYGNLWRIDIRDNDVANTDNADDWGFPWTTTHEGTGGPDPRRHPLPLFQAVDRVGIPQPITAKPQVGRTDGGYMVYFGTGKYFSAGDNIVTSIIASDPQVHTMYGIKDADSDTRVTSRALLLEQQITHQMHETFTNDDGDSFDWDLRVVSNHLMGTQPGWALDLIPPPHIVGEGERVVSVPLLWRDRLIFVTLIPDPNPCAYGGTGWMMEIDPKTGGRLAYSVFDLNRDRGFDADDYVQIGVDAEGKPIMAPVSGIRSSEGIIKTPGVISADNVVYKYTSGSTGVIEVIENAGEGGRGRQSWNQLR
ncbi:MAG: pilus assembly protein [Thiohalomonadaceae bacterium]